MNITKTSIFSKITFKTQDQAQVKLLTRLPGINWNANTVCDRVLILLV